MAVRVEHGGHVGILGNLSGEPGLPRRAGTSTYDAQVREAREGPPVALWLLVGILAVACAVGGMQVAQARDGRARDAAQHARYAEAMAAASKQATAFANVDHETAEEDLARIAEGATGPLKERYTEDAARIARSLRRDRLVTEGEVLWTGVVRVDATSATVLVATTGTRSDRRTEEPVSRELRLRLRLVPVDGEWLASEIEPVD
jgi:Mce-associated membrane protein